MNHTFMSLRWGIWNKETDWTIPNSNHTMTFCQNKITIWGKITQDLSDLQVSEFMSLPYILVLNGWFRTPHHYSNLFLAGVIF